MIEVRFTTDALPWPPWLIRKALEGRTPKIAHYGGALSGLYDS